MDHTPAPGAEGDWAPLQNYQDWESGRGSSLKKTRILVSQEEMEVEQEKAADVHDAIQKKKKSKLL